MENVGIFCDHLEYLADIWYNLWQFGMVCAHFNIFSRFGMFGPRKIWQPWFQIETVVGALTFLCHFIRSLCGVPWKTE
jgi:hypothetical protein